MNVINPRGPNWADEEIAKLRARIADLEAYKRVVSDQPPSPADETPKLGISGRGRKKAAILDFLSYAKEASTADIVNALKNSGMPETAVENTSPQLSFYKSEGLLALSNTGWSVTERGLAALRKMKAEANQ